MKKTTDELKAVSVGTEVITHKHTFGEAEKEELKNRLADHSIEDLILKEELAAVRQRVNRERKKLEKVNTALIKDLHRGFEMQNRNCNMVPNPDTMNMEYWCTETGELLKEVKLTPAERQKYFEV